MSAYVSVRHLDDADTCDDIDYKLIFNCWCEQVLLHQRWLVVVKDVSMEWDYALPCQTYVQIVISMPFGTLFIQLNVL